MLARHFMESFPAGIDLVALTREELDITREIASQVQGQQFDLVINCAAYTQVDLAESNSTLAHEVNVLGTKILADFATECGAKLAHFSTDYVFDGNSGNPYTELDDTNPQGVYGATKLDGEAYVKNGWVFRITWLFGDTGKSFPKTMIKAWLAGKPLRVVDDQIGCPTYCGEVARMVWSSVEKSVPKGIYHMSGLRAMSWYDFAVLSLQTYKEVHGLDLEIEVTPVHSGEWPTAAKRPAYSVLDNAKLISTGIAPHGPIRASLRKFCEANPPDRI
jgi:dTDP-4-dehydrorhamnose reductase